MQRLVLSWVPAVAIVVLAAVAIWGESGLMVRERLQGQLHALVDEHANMESENRRILRELRHMREDPLARERAVADEVGLVRPGSTLVRFHGDTPSVPRR